MTSPRDDAGEDELQARIDKLRRYLESRYDIRIVSLNRLDRGVFRVDRHEGRSWIARVFPSGRPLERAQGDADVPRFLEERGFPAERRANSEPLSSPGGRGVLVTNYIEGTKAEPSELNLRKFGEMLGTLRKLRAGSGGVTREAGSLHHYTRLRGGPRNELEAAVSWLDAVEDRVPVHARALHRSLREQVVSADDCHDLPKALIHPDPVLKNAIATSDSGLVLIDRTGAGRGPRLVSLAVLIWSAALKNGGWSRERVDAMVAGYRSQVQLQDGELGRLTGAMRIRPLVFACWRYRHAIDSGKTPDGSEW